MQKFWSFNVLDLFCSASVRWILVQRTKWLYMDWFWWDYSPGRMHQGYLWICFKTVNTILFIISHITSLSGKVSLGSYKINAGKNPTIELWMDLIARSVQSNNICQSVYHRDTKQHNNCFSKQYYCSNQWSIYE